MSESNTVKSCLIFVLVALSINSIAQTFQAGDGVGSITIGLNNQNKRSLERQSKDPELQKNFRDSVSISGFKGLNPTTLKYEYALSEKWGLGFAVSWWTIKYQITDSYSLNTLPQKTGATDTYDLKFSSVSFGVRGNYHFATKSKRDDLYVGAAIGLTKNSGVVNFSSTYSRGSSVFARSYFEFSSPFYLYLAPTIGLRHNLTENLGAVVECGYEKGAFVMLGFFFRFRPVKYEAIK